VSTSFANVGAPPGALLEHRRGLLTHESIAHDGRQGEGDPSAGRADHHRGRRGGDVLTRKAERRSTEESAARRSRHRRAAGWFAIAARSSSCS